jgi:hypothetical protein
MIVWSLHVHGHLKLRMAPQWKIEATQPLVPLAPAIAFTCVLEIAILPVPLADGRVSQSRGAGIHPESDHDRLTRRVPRVTSGRNGGARGADVLAKREQPSVLIEHLAEGLVSIGQLHLRERRVEIDVDVGTAIAEF